MLFCLCGVSQAIDCRLRGYDGDKIETLNCESTAITQSPLRVTDPSGTVWGVSLVDPGIPGATKIRICYLDASGNPVIKALAYTFSGALDTCEDMQMIGLHPSFPTDRKYYLTHDIDCSATNPSPTNPKYPGSLWQLGYYEFFKHRGYDNREGTDDDDLASFRGEGFALEGFAPLGCGWSGESKFFTGTFDGRGFKVTNLFINRGGNRGDVGLIGRTNGAIVKNLGIVGATISDNLCVGGLVGNAIGHTIITNCYVSGDLQSDKGAVGGLVGQSADTSIKDCYFIGNVTSVSDKVGGLVGTGSVTVDNSFAMGTVSGSASVGGLLGSGTTTITNSFAANNVSSSSDGGGGLVGGGSNITMINSFSTGAVTSAFAGGVIGNYSAGVLANNWWFSANASGVGNSNPAGVTKAGALAEFFGIGSADGGGAVYRNSAAAGASNAWDFVKVWEPGVGILPHLRVKCPPGGSWNSDTEVCE